MLPGDIRGFIQRELKRQGQPPAEDSELERLAGRFIDHLRGFLSENDQLPPSFQGLPIFREIVRVIVTIERQAGRGDQTGLTSGHQEMDLRRVANAFTPETLQRILEAQREAGQALDPIAVSRAREIWDRFLQFSSQLADEFADE